MTRQKQRIMAITLIGVLLCIVSLLALHVGTIMIPIGGGVQSILNGMGIPVSFTEPITAEQEAVLWFIRMPRLIIGLLVGGALALAGAVMQGVFSNPLADPGIMGVSAGASLGAVIAIALGVTSLSMFYMPAFAFVGAFVSVGITILLTWRNNKLDTTTLLLAGVAVSMLLGAFTSGILTMINEYRLREFLFWMVGGLDFRRWDHVLLAVGPIMTGSIISHGIPISSIRSYSYRCMCQRIHWLCRSCGTSYCTAFGWARSSNTIAYGGCWRCLIPRILRYIRPRHRSTG